MIWSSKWKDGVCQIVVLLSYWFNQELSYNIKYENDKDIIVVCIAVFETIKTDNFVNFKYFSLLRILVI